MTDEQESSALEDMIKFVEEDGCLDLTRMLKSVFDS